MRIFKWQQGEWDYRKLRCTISFSSETKSSFRQMQETPHIREVVVSSAKVSDVAASNLKNPQWHTEGPPLSFAVVYKPQPNTFQI